MPTRAQLEQLVAKWRLMESVVSSVPICADELAALLAEPETDGWQPIETAPKNAAKALREKLADLYDSAPAPPQAERSYSLPESERMLAVIREKLWPSRAGYSAEPVDIEEAQYLLTRGDHYERVFCEVCGTARVLEDKVAELMAAAPPRRTA